MDNNTFVTLMIKIVGTRCNMNCAYCYEHVTNHENHELLSAEDIIKYLKEYQNYQHVFVVFHGGEPLLANKDLMRFVLDYIVANFKNKINIQFQTNGLLLNDEWLNVLKNYRPFISVSVSIDPVGEKDLRLSSQSNAREIVVENLKKCALLIENTGVISVIHKYNQVAILQFVQELVELGVHSLTINKYRTDDKNIDFYISEQQYVNVLKAVFEYWVKNKLFNKINIQPLEALFSNKKNRYCMYLADENKCHYFHTLYDKHTSTYLCDHVVNGIVPCVPRKCLACDIYDKCGGGCLVEKKDEKFCEARRNLFSFIAGVKNGNCTVKSQ